VSVYHPKVHLHDRRLFVNAGVYIPACKASAELLDMDTSRWPQTWILEDVTCAKCRAAIDRKDSEVGGAR